MHIEDLEIWSKDPPAPWVRDAADRWARLLVRAALIYLGHFSASPISRTETEILFLLFVFLHVSKGYLTIILAQRGKSRSRLCWPTVFTFRDRR